jgi:hypothetical protein
MITATIINLFYSAFHYLIGLLPSSGLWAVPSGFSTAVHSLFGYIYTFNFILPIPTILTLLSLTLAFEGLLLTYKIIMWIIHLFRPHGGHIINVRPHGGGQGM